MKKFSFIFVVGVLMSTTPLNAQFTFGVSPGFNLNSAYFGYNIDYRFVPYVSLQYFRGSFTQDISTYEQDINTGELAPVNRLIEASGGLIIPTIGLKYFAFESDELRGYFNANISKPMVSSRFEIDGDEPDGYEDPTENLSIWAGELGFGTEYFFSESFSLGGEFGLRWIRVNDEISGTEVFFDPNTGEMVESETDLAFNFSPTYAKISLNFYF